MSHQPWGLPRPQEESSTLFESVLGDYQETLDKSLADLAKIESHLQSTSRQLGPEDAANIIETPQPPRTRSFAGVGRRLAAATLAAGFALIPSASATEGPHRVPKDTYVEASPEQQAPIEVVGDADCKQDVGEALAMLEARTPKYYRIVLGNLATIQCVPEGSGVYWTTEGGVFSVGDKTRTVSTTWLAGGIVHDATHIRLRREYRQAHPDSPGTPDEVWTGEAAETACLQEQEAAMREMGAPPAEIDAVENSLSTRYWEIPFEDRAW